MDRTSNTTLGRFMQSLVQCTSMQQLPDEELLDRFIARQDNAAFAALMCRHGPMVRGVCRRASLADADAEDVLQATFLVLANKAGGLRKRSALGSWLHSVATRLAARARADAARRRKHESKAPLPSAVHPDDVSWGEVRQALDEELTRLPERYRVPVFLCYVEGRTQQEAAKLLRCPRSTLQRRLEKGRSLLQVRLTRRGITLAAALSAGALTTKAAAISPALIQATVKAALGLGGPAGRLSAHAVALAAATYPAVWSVKFNVLVFALAASLCAAICAVAYRPAELPPPSAVPRPVELATGSGNSRRALAPPRGPLMDTFGDPLPAGAVARLGTVRFRHGAWISAVACDPEGRWLASTSRDGTVRLWNPESGQEIRRWPLGHAEGSPLAVAPDARTLAVEGIGHAVLLIDATKPAAVRTLTGHTARLLFLAFAPDGRSLLSGGVDGTARIWDTESDQERLCLHSPSQEPGAPGANDDHVPGTQEYVHGAFTPDGKQILVVGRDGVVHCWEAVTGWPGAAVPLAVPGRPALTAAAFAVDGSCWASAHADRTVRLWEPMTGQLRHTLAGFEQDIHALAFSVDGRTLVTGGGLFDPAGFWDATTGQRTGEVDGLLRRTEALTLTADGRTLFTGDPLRTLRAWDVPTGTERLQPKVHYGHTFHVAFLDGRTLLTGGDASLRIWDLRSSAATAHLPLHRVEDLGVSPDGRTAAVVYQDNTVGLWDLPGCRLVRTLTLPERNDRPEDDRYMAAAFSSDGRWLAVGGEQQTYLWDLRAHQWAGQVPDPAGTLAFHPDGRRLATVGAAAASGRPGALIRLWDLRPGDGAQALAPQELAPLRGPATHRIKNTAFSPDGRYLAGGFAPSGTPFLSPVSTDPATPSLWVWELATGHAVAGFDHQRTAVTAVRFSPDSRTLALGEENGLVRILEVDGGREVACLSGHQGRIYWLAFSPDGRFLASSSGDTTALVWDVRQSLRHRDVQDDAIPRIRR